jgi:hypothetical protein
MKLNIHDIVVLIRYAIVAGIIKGGVPTSVVHPE